MQQRGVHVLYVLDSLAPGGTETSTVQLACSLAQRGVTATIAVLRTDGDDNLLHVEAANGGIDVVHIPGRSWLGRIIALRKLVKDLSPGIVHTALYRADLTGRLACAGLSPVVVSSLVGTPYAPERRRYDPAANPVGLQMARVLDGVTARLLTDGLHAVSTGTAKANVRHLHLRSERITVIERGRHFAAPEPRSGGVTHRLPIHADGTIAVIGREDRVKDHVTALRAFEVILRSRPKTRLILAGKRGDASELLDHAIDRSIAKNQIARLGHVPRVYELLESVSVVMISSRMEGTAGVAIEAMAAGVPIVATAVPGMVGVLEHRCNALVAPVGDAPALAHHVLEVLSDQSLAYRLAEAGRKTFEARFTMDRYTDRFLDFYSSTLRDSGRITWATS